MGIRFPFQIDKKYRGFEVNILEQSAIFSDYIYFHEKFLVNPSSRGSSVNDPLEELELELIKKWEFSFPGIFAKAKIVGSISLNFYYVDNSVVDECHLNLEYLIKQFNEKLKKSQKI